MVTTENIKNISEFEDKSLLIVDDDNPFRERLARAMEKKGFKVSQAEGVKKGIDCVKQEKPAFAVVDLRLGDGMYYNKWMDGNQIAMPAPIYDGSVDYDDGTDNNAAQLSEDVVTFLKWSAEPELEIRKNLGIKVILFFLVLGTIVYLAKNRLWREVH